MPKTSIAASAHEPPPAFVQADPTRRQPVGRTRNERYMIGALEHRLGFLETLWVTQSSPDPRHRAQARERDALRFALRRIYDAERLELDRAGDGL